LTLRAKRIQQLGGQVFNFGGLGVEETPCDGVVDV